MQLEELISQKANEICDKKLAGIVEKALEHSITSIIDDLFRWSDSQKQLKEKIKASIGVAIENFSLDKYNVLIAQLFEKSVGQMLNEKALSILNENISKIISPIEKKQWKLSEIVKVFAQLYMSENDDIEYFEPYVGIEHSNYGSTYIYIDKEDKDNYNCKYKLYLNKDGECFISSIEGKSELKDYYDEFDRLVLNLWTNNCTIKVDAYETEFNRNY